MIEFTGIAIVAILVAIASVFIGVSAAVWWLFSAPVKLLSWVARK